MAGQGLVELEAAADLRHRDPARARELAAAATAAADPEVAAVANWIVGLAEHELANPAAAVEAFSSAIDLADRAGLPDRAAVARASMAVSLLGLGRRDEALAAIDRALDEATGPERAFVGFLHGLVLQRNGQLDAAAEAYDRSRPLLEAAGDRASLARLLLNLGTLHAYRSDLPAAIDAFGRSEVLARALDLPVLVAMAAHNTGFALGRWGDIPGALDAFDRAAGSYRELGDPGRLVGVLAADRCEVLLDAGLVSEARDAAETALDLLLAVDEVAHRDEALLQAARVDLAAGDLEVAGARARSAADGFRSSGRRPWAALADYVALQAEVAATQDLPGPPSPRLLARTRRIARALEREGWPVEAAHAQTFFGRMALATGRTEVARDPLGRAARIGRRGGPALRIQAWHATALLHLADGDRSAANRALRRGLAVVDEHREALGASELRANAAARGEDLARLGLRLARDRGRPGEVLRWAEHHRAGALHPPAARPPADPVLAERRADLRQAQAALREATLAGDPTAPLRAGVEGAERRLRDRSRLAHGTHVPRHALPPLSQLRDRLDGRVLVEHVESDGILHAVVVDRRSRLVVLGPAEAVAVERAHLRAALRRLLRAALDGEPVRLAAARRALTASAARLDELVVAPLRLRADAEVVLVPTGAGHGVAWSTLPSLTGRRLTVAPSAALWVRPADDRSGRSLGAPPLLVAGPELPGAEREVRAIAGSWPDAAVLTGSAAGTDAVIEAMGRTDLVHLAAHGTFRADSPQFSSLLLADGALTVFDLEALERAPAVVVLPACSAARSEVRAGDELLGTTAALVRLGVRSVIAPVMAVPDQATAVLTVALHARLAGGETPAAALAAAAAVAREAGDPLAELAAAAFVCVGADDRVSG